jgi:abortive infection bacteriophage resistance protein
MKFSKKVFTIEEHIALLKERGLEIENEELAKKYLSNISYYRLAGYWWSMQENKEEHLFKPESTFSNVIAIYNFDADLRILLFDAIEKIEISLRTKLIYYVSHEHGPWWFQNSEIFEDSQALIKTLDKIREEIERSKDTFIKEHMKKYKKDLRFPPSWKTLELTSFGALSKLYGNLKNTVKSKDSIAQEFGAVNHTYLPSWLQSIAQIRNFCAHHSRLWNKNLPGTVKLLRNPPNKWISEVPKEHEFKYLYVHMALMRYLLNTIHPKNTFNEDLKQLMKKYSNIDPNALGFKDNWQNEPLWK